MCCYCLLVEGKLIGLMIVGDEVFPLCLVGKFCGIATHLVASCLGGSQKLLNDLANLGSAFKIVIVVAVQYAHAIF